MGPTEASVRVLHCRTAIFNKKKKKHPITPAIQIVVVIVIYMGNIKWSGEDNIAQIEKGKKHRYFYFPNDYRKCEVTLSTEKRTTLNNIIRNLNYISRGKATL